MVVVLEVVKTSVETVEIIKTDEMELMVDVDMVQTGAEMLEVTPVDRIVVAAGMVQKVIKGQLAVGKTQIDR
jgi:hypothetical protein